MPGVFSCLKVVRPDCINMHMHAHSTDFILVVSHHSA
jgi:hypothetical protein